MWISRLRHSGKCQAVWAAVGVVVAFAACILMMWLLDFVLLWPIELGAMVVLELLALLAAGAYSLFLQQWRRLRVWLPLTSLTLLNLGLAYAVTSGKVEIA